MVRGVDASGSLANEVIEQFLDTHLIRAEKRAGVTWYEVSHDRLLEPIARDNATWREEHLNEVQKRASLWELEDRLPGLLLEDKELLVAERWAADHVAELTELELRFLAASREAADHVAKLTKLERRYFAASRKAKVVRGGTF